MRLPVTILVLSAAVAFGALAPAYAANNNNKKGNRGAARLLVRFDTNHDGTLDAAEAERVRRMFTALLALDTDHDGKLSDSEIAAAKIPARKAQPANTTPPAKTSN